MGLTENALAVLRRRYLDRLPGGELESPDAMFRRVARSVAEVERSYGGTSGDVERVGARFFDVMQGLRFLPNSPTLMNGGRPGGQLAACFVVPIDDSMESIFDALKAAALIHRTGGGTGFSFSKIRPAGDPVASTGGVASGPVSFMQVFDAATEAIKQGGRRRGANMAVLRADHPDVLDFIALKLDSTRMRNFNLSVGITDAFMQAVESRSDYALVNPASGEVVRRVDARRVYDLICNTAWATGDPGLVFLDRVNAAQPTPQLGAIEATNPCGEQPLLPFESCTLGSINLAAFCSEGQFEWDAFDGVVADAVRFLDNVIDANHYPLPEIAQATLATRKIGLGVMAFADALIELGHPYESDEALRFADKIASRLHERARRASEALADERGPFSEQARSPGAEAPRRNATTTTVAPTGTISIIAGCSSGIEPIYALSFERHVLDGEVLHEIHPALRARARARGLWTPVVEAAVRETGTLAGLAGVPGDWKALFATAHEISPAAHVRVQAAFQRHVDAAVSKTINLPKTATPADIADAYRLAHELGCKGVTVFRDGSRGEQVLVSGQGRAAAPSGQNCPECGKSGTIAHQRCAACPHCGWSACSL